MKRVDLIVGLIIGELSALLMLAIGRNLGLPSGLRSLLPWLPLAFPVFTVGFVTAGSLAGRSLGVGYQFSKFLLVGGLNLLIDLGVLNLLIAATDITTGFYVSVFKAISFSVAVASSFLWNKFWTFRSLSTERVALQFTEFFGVSAGGLAINVGVFSLVNNLIGPRAGIDPTTWATVSGIAAATAGLAWNFLGYKFFVFRRRAV